jgi:hypothetical protein
MTWNAWPQPPTRTDEPAQEERRSLMTNLRSFDLQDPQMLIPPVVVTYWDTPARCR